MDKVIGVLGCGGTVGYAACHMLLERGYKVIGAQRKEKVIFSEFHNFCQQSVDIYDTPQLKKFCEQCDIILNCAGPSGVIKDLVAVQAIESKASYVDVFGDIILKNELEKKGLGTAGKIVVSAGCYPGLSGILPIWLARKYFYDVTSILAYGGGKEECSGSAAIDVILSAIEGFGRAEQIYKNGTIIKELQGNPEKIYLPIIEREVYFQKFLHNEIIKVAKQLNAMNASWYNISDEMEVNETITKWCSKLYIDRSDNNLKKAVKDFENITSKKIDKNDTWYVMVVEVEGETQEGRKRKQCMIWAPNSYQITANIAVEATEYLIEKPLVANGVYWAFELLAGEKIIDGLVENKIIKKFFINDVDLNVNNEVKFQTESGCI